MALSGSATALALTVATAKVLNHHHLTSQWTPLYTVQQCNLIMITRVATDPQQSIHSLTLLQFNLQVFAIIKQVQHAMRMSAYPSG